MLDPSGRVAFVTGAASGIGLGIARQLALAGARVAMADIRADALEAARAEVAALGADTFSVLVDVSDPASLEAAADTVEREFGNVQIVFNNAGIAMHGVTVDKVELADWDWVVNVNIFGVIHGIRTFVPRLKARGEGGHIVNTASIGGMQVNPTFLTGPYSMTKYAVVALSESLNNELADTDIGVSVLCPMAVATGIHLSARSRPERMGGPHERPQDHFMGDLIKDGLSPDAIGERLIAAIKDGDFFVFTHPETREWLEKRNQRIVEGFDQLDAFEEKQAARNNAATSNEKTSV